MRYLTSLNLKTAPNVLKRIQVSVLNEILSMYSSSNACLEWSLNSTLFLPLTAQLPVNPGFTKSNFSLSSGVKFFINSLSVIGRGPTSDNVPTKILKSCGVSSI